MLQRRNQFGAFHHLVQELHDNYFRSFFRVTVAQFERVLEAIQEDITKISKCREPINAKEHLALTSSTRKHLLNKTSLVALNRNSHVGYGKLHVVKICTVLSIGDHTYF